MAFKILLIVPPNITFQDYINPPGNTKGTAKGGKEYGSLITDMPLGVISLNAYIKKHIDCEIELIDFNVELNKVDSFEFESFEAYFRDVLEAKYEKNKYDVIGISALFSTAYRSLIELGDVFSTLYDEAIIIAGGNVPTVSYKEIYRDTDAFHAVCHGEGDVPLLNLLQSENMLEYFESSSNWITKEKILKHAYFEHNFIENLDEIPFDYSLIHPENYALNPTINSYAGVGDGKESFNIMTSRGCPFKCVFCASHATHGRAMRYESLERVKANILELKEKGVGVITFEDDHFMGSKTRAYDIVRYVGDLGLTAFFPNSLALYALSRKMLEALKRAGVNSLILAIESGSERVLKHVMKKPLKLDIVSRVAKDCREIGIYTDCNILFGLPGETKQDIEDSQNFLKTVKANWFRINVATPLIGSEMHEVCEDKSYFKGIVVESNYKKAIVETEDFTAAYIQEVTYDTNIDLNFVHNADLEMGDYEVALNGFKNVINAKPDHALAHYYASICYEELGHKGEAEEHFDKYISFSKNVFWEKYITKYDLPSKMEQCA